MSKLTDIFLAEAERKNLQFNSKVIERFIKDSSGQEIPHNQLILQTALQVDEKKVVPCSIIIHDTDDLEYVNCQMNYNRIGLVTDRHELPTILEKVNELNSMKSGYYHFVVNPDGELNMRYLGVMGMDPVPAITTFMHGGRILRAVMGELKELKGLDVSNLMD